MSDPITEPLSRPQRPYRVTVELEAIDHDAVILALQEIAADLVLGKELMGGGFSYNYTVLYARVLDVSGNVVP